MKKWLARIGWMVLGIVLLSAFVITKSLLFSDWGQRLPDASSSQIDAIIASLKKENCSYVVNVYVPKKCRVTLDEAIKQSSSKTSPD